MKALKLGMCLLPWKNFLSLTQKNRDKLRNAFKKDQPQLVTFLEEYGEDYMTALMVASSVEIALLLHYTYTFHGATVPRVRRARLEHHLRQNQAFMDDLAVANASQMSETADALYQARPQTELRARMFDEVWKLFRRNGDDDSRDQSRGAFERQVQIEERMQVLLGAVLDSFEEIAVEDTSTTVKRKPTKT